MGNAQTGRFPYEDGRFIGEMSPWLGSPFPGFESRRLHSFYSGKHARYFWLSDVDLLAVTTA
jgi:hypothetical protein